MDKYKENKDITTNESLKFSAEVRKVSHAPICKNNLMLFEEHCVIFYAKFVIDDPVGSRIINVIQKFLFINK